MRAASALGVAPGEWRFHGLPTAPFLPASSRRESRCLSRPLSGNKLLLGLRDSILAWLAMLPAYALCEYGYL